MIILAEEKPEPVTAKDRLGNSLLQKIEVQKTNYLA